MCPSMVKIDPPTPYQKACLKNLLKSSDNPVSKIKVILQWVKYWPTTLVEIKNEVQEQLNIVHRNSYDRADFHCAKMQHWWCMADVRDCEKAAREARRKRFAAYMHMRGIENRIANGRAVARAKAKAKANAQAAPKAKAKVKAKAAPKAQAKAKAKAAPIQAKAMPRRNR